MNKTSTVLLSSVAIALLASCEPYSSETTDANASERVAEQREFLEGAPTLDFTANPSYVPEGGSSTLSWSATGADTCQAQHGWTGSKPLSGTQTLTNLRISLHYVLVCTNQYGRVEKTATVIIDHSRQAPPSDGSPDTSRPTTPTGLSATTTSNSVQLSWAAASDNVGVTGYHVHRNGVRVGSPSSTSYTDTGLTASTVYSYTVSAFDAAGNVSATSAAHSATTQAAQQQPPPPPPPATSSAVFPLVSQTGRRYFTTQQGKPFFLVGDAAWSMAVKLSREEVVQYLNDRAWKGFNAALVSIIDPCFTIDSVGYNCGTPGKNFYGHVPFEKNAAGKFDFTRPIDAYWRHVDYIVQEMNRRNMLLLAVPSYLGYDGGGEGWYSELVTQGYAALRSYGQFLGSRYGGNANILWVQGGDYNAPDKELIRTLVNGIRERAPNSLHTYHGARFTPSARYMAGESWLGVNAVYTDKTVAVNNSSRCYGGPCGVLNVYGESVQPFFLIEGTYEEAGILNSQEVRSQAYQAILSGAFGQVMGNVPVWYFNSGWQSALWSDGARSIEALVSTVSPLKWWLLVPDSTNSLLPAQTNRVTHPAASASDGSFALAYFPGGSLTVNLSRLAGPRVRATWVDPYNGWRTTDSTLYSNAGATTFSREVNNGNGHRDWLLLLESTQ